MKTVLIHYFNPHNLDTARLFVKTIRVGFPTWEIQAHFASIDTLLIEECIKQNIGVYTTSLQHSAFIDLYVRNARNHKTLVFCDPDVIFYENMEWVDCGSEAPFIMGTYCPQYVNEVYRAIEYPRLHTALMYVNKPREICALLDKRGPVQHLCNENPWTQHVFSINGMNYMLDTGASVYGMLNSKGIMVPFSDDFRERFSHIHSGTMSPIVAPYLKKREGFELVHKLALENPEALRGLWREQDLYYKQNQNYADVTS